MRKWISVATEGIQSILRRVVNRAANDVSADLQAAKQKGSNGIRYGTVLVTEKWLGFCLAFLLTMLPALMGLGLIKGVQWTNGIPTVVNTIPGVISYVGTAGFLVTLLSGPALIGLFVVTVVRVLLWMQESVKHTWECHTPPFNVVDSNLEANQWPPSEDVIKAARKKWVSFTLWGSTLFLLLTTCLLQLEVSNPKILHTAVSHPHLSPLADLVAAAFWIIDIEGVLHIVAPNVSQSQIIYFLLLFVIPGVLFSVAARNVLFLTETYIREEIEEATKRNQSKQQRLRLGLIFVFLSVLVLPSLYGLFTSL